MFCPYRRVFLTCLRGMFLSVLVQVMEEASLPMLTPFAMVPVVLLAPSMGLRAKTSVHARNTVIQLGIGMLVLSNLAFMLLPSPAGG